MKNWLAISLIVIGIVGAVACVILSVVNTYDLYFKLFHAVLPYIIGIVLFEVMVFVGFILKDE